MKPGHFILSWLLPFILGACGVEKTTTAHNDLSLEDLRSGSTFLQPDTLALQEDDFANPGFLWVDRGKALFEKQDGTAKACAVCHADGENSLAGAAARYPALDEETQTLVNLEGRINLCRERHQEAAPLAYESDELLSLTSYVAHLSRGQPVSTPLPEALRPNYDRGRAYYFTRRGQLNLACHQCHDQNWGKMLRGDRISQGHGNGFPAYRLEWQGLGSLHRRIRDCDTGVRAEPLPYGSQTYLDLELYLARRAQGLTIETPAVRR